MQGTVRWFSPRKGFGFIFSKELGGDIFVHVSDIISNGGVKTLCINDVVEFETAQAVKGLKAIKAKVVEKGVKKDGQQSHTKSEMAREATQKNRRVSPLP